ncbi:phosphatidylglycerophosphatase A family protein [Chachezhania sediminis]|uniref:phosphatidylglycerophosphatase A family protein n=1 Tax=Chachezhania sediminis TaxID=2599291 RepID=UPI00131DCA6F|nr:phosphatidylglycerophosphatase A [Chachezhania sediminis]
MSNLATMVGTVCGVGRLRPAPGTWGSLAAFPILFLVHWIGGPLLLVALICVLIGAGLWAADRMHRDGWQHDAPDIVIDEVAGQLVTLLPISFGAAGNDVSLLALWPGLVSGFILFRLLDIWKPGPIGWADRKDGAIGVMSDDLIAGVLAALGVIIMAGIAHGVMRL